jgi:hypothetical protein
MSRSERMVEELPVARDNTFLLIARFGGGGTRESADFVTGCRGDGRRPLRRLLGTRRAKRAVHWRFGAIRPASPAS